MKLSAPMQKPISFLKKNKSNGQFFEEKGIDLSSMIEDIKKRGVLVPFVAKPDGTLLAGHCRMRSAIQAGLKNVPVRIAEDMTEDEELEFLLKDNTVRRHFGQADRLKIYRRIYPNFDKDILVNRAISTEKIVSISGLCMGTVNGDFYRIRKMATDIRKKRTPEENLLVLYRRITTQIRNKLINGEIQKDQISEILEPLRKDMVTSIDAGYIKPKMKTLTSRG